MSNAVFPANQLAGLQWSVKRTPNFATLKQRAVNGNMVRIPELQDPLWDFDIGFEFLRDRDASDEFATLLTFFEARQGAYDSFLLYLPDLTQNALDGLANGVVLAADANNCVPLLTPLGEQIYELNTQALFNNGTAITEGAGTSDYEVYSAPQTASGTLNANGIAYRGCVARLGSAVTPGTITGNLSWSYRVRFAEDAQDFEAFSYLLYEAQSMKLTTARE
ncbi:MAG: DUF2460 domain-containing protein [Terriglobales bacterium]|jgi:hypothetical protein